MPRGDSLGFGGARRIRGGAGRNKGGAFGPGGFCICAHCGYKTPHHRGEKCTLLRCPECGKPLIREELLNQKKISRTE